MNRLLSIPSFEMAMTAFLFHCELFCRAIVELKSRWYCLFDSGSRRARQSGSVVILALPGSVPVRAYLLQSKILLDLFARNLSRSGNRLGKLRRVWFSMVVFSDELTIVDEKSTRSARVCIHGLTLRLGPARPSSHQPCTARRLDSNVTFGWALVR